MSGLADLAAAYARSRDGAQADDAVGYIGLDIPVELIAAAGVRPVRVWAQPASAGADAFAEGGGSPLLRSLASAVLEGRFKTLKWLVISTTPAAYVWLYAFLREIKSGGEGLASTDIALFDLNLGAAAAGARRQAVDRLKAQLQTWTAKPIGPALFNAAIAAQGHTRDLLRRVQGLREGGAPKLSGVEALTIFGAADAMSAEAYQQALTAVLAERAHSPPLPGRRTIYSGGETVSLDLYRRLEAAGSVIVADDQDGGWRGVGPKVTDSDDAVAALGEAYAARAPEPARSTIAARTAYLLDLAGRTCADHVVFNIAAFDHPPAWELPSLRDALTGAGVTSELMEAGHG